jgi:protein-S-isoprenylcysteine O-methyltransferase Ste14
VIFARWIAALVLFLQLPVPLYWFVVHPQIDFWRRHQKAAYCAGVLLSWPVVTVCLVVFRQRLFLSGAIPIWRIALGFAFIVLEAWIFWRVQHDLGMAKFVGKTELLGGGEIVSQGIYAYIRNPRYVGSFIAILGACFLAGTVALWIVAAVWAGLMRVAISMEEREMRARLGDSYMEYCRRVPRFLPLLS